MQLQPVKNSQLEILEYNYWEHFKMAKDIALFLPIHHPKRLLIEKNLNELQSQILKLKTQ